jgi:electron transfer flavoprotein beta subunit
MSLNLITVLVSASKHPITSVPRHHHNDSLALQTGLHLANKYAATMQVLHAGEAGNPALQDYLALGASQIDVVSAADNVVNNLANQLSQTDLILTGTRAQDAENSGLLPYLLSAKLKLAIVANALQIRLHDNSLHKNQLEVLQFLPKGQRRWVVVTLPAVIVVHPLASVALRFVHAQRNLGSIHQGNIHGDSTHVTNKTPTYHNAKLQLGTQRKIIKLKAQTKQTGHERLMDAITSKNKGGTVVIEGNSVEKAQVIITYLREHQLINF